MQRKDDILYNIIDSKTAEMSTYSKVEEFYDGTPMTDAKVDGIIYTKLPGELAGEFFKRNFLLFNIKWFGIKGDGKLNELEAIQKAIDFCAYKIIGFYGEATGFNMGFPEGVYKIAEAAIVIPFNAGISITGADKTKSTIFQETPGLDCIQVNGNNYRGKFEKIRLTGPQGQVSGPSKAINITGNGNQIYVEDCWINTFGHGIYCNPSSDSNFTNNTFEYVHKPFTLKGNGSGFYIVAHNNFYNCGPVGQGAEEASETFLFEDTKNLDFHHNRFTNDAAMSPQSGGWMKVNNCNSFNFSKNEFDGVHLGKLFVITDCESIQITGNKKLPSTQSEVFDISNSSNVKILHNRLQSIQEIGFRPVHLAKFNNVINLDFAENTVGKTTLYGVLVDNCNGVNVNSNIFDGGSATAAYSPVYLTNSLNASVNDNNFKNGLENNWDILADLCPGLVVDGNNLQKGYVIDKTCFRGKVISNGGGEGSSFYSAAPVEGEGSWIKNDFLLNHDASNGIYGFLCISSGSPGTWTPVLSRKYLDQLFAGKVDFGTGNKYVIINEGNINFYNATTAPKKITVSDDNGEVDAISFSKLNNESISTFPHIVNINKAATENTHAVNKAFVDAKAAEPVANITDVATATTEQIATKLNELMAALRVPVLLKQ